MSVKNEPVNFRTAQIASGQAPEPQADPRIAAADAMAKALETLTEQLGFRPVGAEAKRKRELLIQAGWEAGCTALAAYNALK